MFSIVQVSKIQQRKIPGANELGTKYYAYLEIVRLFMDDINKCFSNGNVNENEAYENIFKYTQYTIGELNKRVDLIVGAE